MIEGSKDFLSQRFEMKDMGEADVILNIRLLREGNSGVTLIQSYYVEKIMSHFGYSDFKFVPTRNDPSDVAEEPKNHKRSIEILSNHWLANVLS